MKPIISYNIYDILNLYKENKHIIDSYINNNQIEGFNNEKDNNIIEADITMIIIIIIIGILSFVLWIWALVLTIVRWNKLTKYRKIICIVFLLLTWSTIPVLTPFLSPIIVLITIYTNESKNKKIKKTININEL